jgi:hypothetical protein
MGTNFYVKGHVGNYNPSIILGNVRLLVCIAITAA